MKCPKCNEDDLYRDEVDVGVGIIYGPYGCQCGWSEEAVYDQTNGPKFSEGGGKLDQWGGLTPKSQTTKNR